MVMLDALSETDSKFKPETLEVKSNSIILLLNSFDVDTILIFIDFDLRFLNFDF